MSRTDLASIAQSLGIDPRAASVDLARMLAYVRSRLNVAVYGDTVSRPNDHMVDLLERALDKATRVASASVEAAVEPTETETAAAVAAPTEVAATPTETSVESTKATAKVDPSPWNQNGLVQGTIPAGKPCPFAEECSVLTVRCPTEKNLLPHAFSCARARLISLSLTLKRPPPP